MNLKLYDWSLIQASGSYTNDNLKIGLIEITDLYFFSSKEINSKFPCTYLNCILKILEQCYSVILSDLIKTGGPSG